MQCFNLDGARFERVGTLFAGESILPSDSILLQRTPFNLDSADWSGFFQACQELSKIVSPSWVMIDASWDPVRLSNIDISRHRLSLQEIWPHARCLILSARAQHFYDQLPGCVYFPQFLMLHYPEPVAPPKQGRLGCLNRRNAAHRVWLMHHLLDQRLLDPIKDIYSVRFTCQFTDSYYDVDPLVGTTWFNQAQRQWPSAMATHPDGWPSDYSIHHPAWHTGIVIITETEPGEHTLICEKTAKGILSQSCFSVYMGDVGYRVLEDLGFLPRFFPTHAENFDIDPVLQICRDIASESQAMEYRSQYLEQIQHNFDWFAFEQGGFSSRPWFAKYQPKLQQALDSL